ncbi:MAG: SusC/RagA family TonB-linked outer membrane protein [Bacteroidota bacterium]
MKKYYFKKYVILWLLLLLINYAGLAQQQLIKGSVKGLDGVPVSGAIISVKEVPGVNVSSDADGKFAISGQIGQHIEVVTLQNLNKTFVITSDSMVLPLNERDELIRLGFGIEQRKGDLTSAIGIVRSDELSKSSAINPANALFGKIPGLSVMENGGPSWGNDPDLYIRGVGTFGNAALLVLVDGFERPISSLSLPEIENIEVLKDAAALAIYGQRGANGVLLVTTKRGSVQGSRVDVSYEHGITQAFRLPNFLDAYGYASSVNQARSNDGLSPLYSQVELSAYKSGSSPYLYPNINWLNETLRNFGTTDNMNASFQGKIKGIKYFTMLNYQTDNGLLGPVDKNSGYSTQLSYKKFNFRTNLDIDLSKSTIFKVNVGGNLRESRSPGSGLDNIMNALYSVPSAAFPVKTYNGEWGGTATYANNPVALVSATGYGVQYTRELLGDLRIEQKLDVLLSGLSAEVAAAYDNSATFLEGKTKQFRYESLAGIKNPGGAIIDTAEVLYGTNTELNYYNSLGSQWRHATFEGKLKYSKEWGANAINSVLLFQSDKLVKTGQYNTFIHELAALNTHYSRSGKYFADLSISYSGTNVLPKSQRFGVFPALSLAWRLSDEDWFSKNKVLNNLKIRSSWGMTGNDLIPQNISTTRFTWSSQYYYTANNNAAGGLREQLGTSGATYETSTKSNVGIDATLFRLLDLNLDLFYDRRKNILVESTGLISGVMGASLPLTNAGIMTNKGFELGINFHKSKGDFNYHINGQVSFVRNKIIETGEIYLPYNYLKRTGKSYGQAFGLEAISFFKDAADIANSPKQVFSEVKPGDIKYKDQNDDGAVDEYDTKPIGFNMINPELYFSASIGVEYKGIGIDALFQGVGNQTLYLNTPGVFWPLRGNTSITDFSNNSWTAETASTATLPRLSTLENANNYRPNSIWLVNGSFLKLKSLELYYNFPKQLISDLRISNLRLYIRGINLFSIDNTKSLDPEALGVTYPTMSSFNMGIKLDF